MELLTSRDFEHSVSHFHGFDFGDNRPDTRGGHGQIHVPETILSVGPSIT